MSIRRGTPGDLVFVASPEQFNRDVKDNPWDLAFYGSYGAKLNPTRLKNSTLKWNIEDGCFVITQNFANAGSQLLLQKSRGNTTDPNIIVDGDTIASIYMSGYDGAQYQLGAFISAVADGVVTATSVPAKLVFGTSPGEDAIPQAELLGDGTLKVKRIAAFDDTGLELIFNDGTMLTSASSITINSTDDVPEGALNLYYTDARVRGAISTQALTGIFYNPTTGVINLANIPNSSLANSSITINGNNVALGGSTTITFDYNSLTNKPVIPAVPTNISAFNNNAGYITQSALSGYATQEYVTTYVTSQNYITASAFTWSNLSEKPSFAPVAFSGNYLDLVNKPTSDGISEGVTNQYFTLPRVRTALSASGNVRYNLSTGVIGFTPNPIFDIVTATTLEVKNITFTGIGPVSISSGNDINLTAVGDIFLNGKSLSNVAFSGSYNDLSNKPTLFSGSYADLINKPTIPTDVSQLTDTGGLLGSSSDGTYTLPTASSSVLGGIKIGSGLTIDGSGVVSVTSGGSVASVNGQTGVVTLTSSNIAEGTNQYFTTARARSSVSAGTGLSYNSTTGVISADAIPNASLTNSSITIGTTAISLGSSATTVAGLANVVTKKSSYANSSNVSKVYTYYNEETQSLDTVFE